MQNIKIPQNVQIEDKLVGPFSLKQLLLVALGGGFSYALYASINKSVGYVPVAAHMFIWLPGILSAAFALVRINDLSLFRCCLLVIEMMSKPRQRSLLPRQGIIINIQTHGGKKKRKEGEEEGEAATKAAVPIEKALPPKVPERLEELTRMLDTEGSPVDTAKRMDTVFSDTTGDDAHRKRIDALWEESKKRNIDSIRPRSLP